MSAQMKKEVVWIFVALGMWALTLVTVPPQAEAAGFGLYEWSNRGNAMGGAIVATQNPDASTVAYNPAAMTRLEGMQTMVGTTMIAPSADVNILGGEHVTTKGKVYVVPHGYGTIQLTDRLWFGVGEFTRFGLGTNYDHNWEGAYNMYKASVETFSVNPSLAAKVTDELSLAVGVEYVYGKMDLRKDNRLNPNVPGASALFNEWVLHPQGDAWTWNAALHYVPTDWLSVGVTYRDWYKFEGTGTGRFTTKAANDDVTMWANFPGSLTVGVAVKPFDDLTIEADYIWTEWSSFKSMVYEFSDKTVGNIYEITANEVTSVKQYDDATRIQIGAEYLVDENWTLRMGYVFDESPQNDDYTDYMLPSSDRHIVSTGVGYSWGPWTTDLSLMYLWAKDRDIDNSLVDNTEIINCTTWLGGLSVGYKF